MTNKETNTLSTYKDTRLKTRVCFSRDGEGISEYVVVDHYNFLVNWTFSYNSVKS